MRIARILLVLVFLAVAAVSAVQGMADRFSTDDDPPAIVCSEETLNISVKEDDSVLFTGITASDPQDGDITGKILITGVSRLFGDNNARVSYAVFDSDSNMASCTRLIHYTDYQLPRFSLEEPLCFRFGESVDLMARLHARDVIDGDITGSIRVTFSQVVEEPGVHTINVQVTNSMGDTAWQTLPVVVYAAGEEPISVALDTYLVYLPQGSDFQARRYLQGASLGGDPISTDNVTISGEVDTATPGTYMVEYTCTYGSRSGTAVLAVVIE